MFFVPTCMPTAKARMTKASQPKTAVFQWLALQRPIRAAMLLERLSGDIRLLLRWLTAPASHRGVEAEMRLAGVLAVWFAEPRGGEGRRGERRPSEGGGDGGPRRPGGRAPGSARATAATARERSRA